MPIPFSEEETATAAVPWSVSATHTNFNQTITSSTALTTSGGVVGYYDEADLFDDHNISLPRPGTIRHFVSPEQPIFTFSQPTRVFMIFPTTTPTTPIKEAGWIFNPFFYHTVSGPFIGLDTSTPGVITNITNPGNDYCYEKIYQPGTHNLDSTGISPEAFYLFEELVDGNLLNEVREWQVHWFENGLLADYFGKYSTDREITTTGNLSAANITGSGIIEVGKNSAGVSHINMARIESASFGTGSMVGFSHHDRQLGSNLALAQTDLGETLINSETGTKLTFRIGGLEKMRVNPNGDVGIGTSNPLQKLHVEGSIKASGSLEAAKDTQSTSFLGKAKISHIGDAASFSHHNFGALQNYALLQNDLGQTVINGAANQFIAFKIDNGDKMRLMSDGKFGIGTTNPGKLLDVVGGDIRTTGTLEAHADSNDATAVSQIGFAKIGANTWNDTVSFSHKDKHNSTSFGLRLGKEGHTVLNSAAGKYTQLTIGNFQAIHIGQNKNVRIGSTVSEPSHKLHVDGDFKATDYIINGHKTTVSNDSMHFYTGTPSGDVLRMAIMGNTANTSGNYAVGNVGINVSTYEEKLHVGGNIKASGNVIATNIKNYYQTTNSENSTIGDNSNSTTQVTNAGCPSSASDWIRYLSWKTTGVDTVNSNTNIFSPQNYGFKALVAGTYKITVNLAIQAQGQNQGIVMRLAKNALQDEVADSDQENPGPLAGTGYIPGFTGSGAGKINSFGSASITHIMSLAVNDEVSIYTVNVGQVFLGSGVNSFTREGYSQFLAEYLG